MTDIDSARQKAWFARNQAQRRCRVMGLFDFDFRRVEEECTRFLEPHVLQAVSKDEAEKVVLEKTAEFWDEQFGCV